MKRVGWLAWPALVCASVLLVFAPVLGGERTLARRDTDRLYAPMRALVVDALRASRLPLWNPHESMGKALFAEGMHSVLHPVSLLGAFVAPSSVDFLILAYLLAAALGSFALGRTLGASRPAAAGTGIAFALSGYVVSMTGNLVFLAGAASLPWVVAAARLAGGGSRWGVPGSALAASVAFFSGDVQVALVGIAAGILLAADAGGRRGAVRACAGFGVGILLAGVQLAASWRELALTDRGVGICFVEKQMWPLEPARIVEWIVPGLYRGELTAPLRDAAHPNRPTLAWLAGGFTESVYVGPVLLLATALGLRRPTGLVLAAGAGLLLWIALGPSLGASQLLDVMPLWNRFRYAEKLMAPLALCLSAAAALGMDRIVAGPLPRAASRGAWAVGLACASALAVLVTAPAVSASLLARGLAPESAAYLVANLRRGLPYPAVAMAALLALDIATRGRRAARAPLLALLIAAESAAAVPFGAHFGSKNAHVQESPLRLDTDSPCPRLAHPLLPLLGTPALDAIDASVLVQRLLLIPSVNVGHHIDDVDSYSGFDPLRYQYLHASPQLDWFRAARRFALTHVVFPTPDPAAIPAATIDELRRAVEGGTLAEKISEPSIEAWEVPHRPWAFFAASAVAVSSTDEAYAVLLGLIDRRDDRTVVVEGGPVPQTASGNVLSADRGTEEIRIEAESAGSALLVVNDAWWPGWRAFIDGVETAVLPADILVRAVRWPAGRHLLVMRYDPPEVRWGLAISAAGVLALATLLVSAARQDRR